LNILFLVIHLSGIICCFTIDERGISDCLLADVGVGSHHRYEIGDAHVEEAHERPDDLKEVGESCVSQLADLRVIEGQAIAIVVVCGGYWSAS
jgi:hypothetical protein